MKRKNLLLRISLLSILFITIPKSYSQIPVSPGYVILDNNDTIYGNIENDQLGSLNKCVIIKEGTSTIQFLKPEQVFRFFISPDFYFQAKQIGRKNTYLQLISEGKINLYKGNTNLYISCISDSLVLLDGKKEYFVKNGKTYLTERTSYKTSIKKCVTDTSYYRQIAKMSLDKNAIIRLIKEINDPDFTSPIKSNNKILHRNQYSFDFGYSINIFPIHDLGYNNDSLFVGYGNSGDMENRVNPNHILNAWQIGFSYKRNLKSTNFYFYGGVKCSKLQKTYFDRLGMIYSTLVLPNNGSSYFTDSIGSIKDQYHYDLTQISFPVGFYEEISHNRLRPFYSVGISGNLFLKKNIILNRTVYLENTVIEENTYKLDISAFSLGTTLEAGCRYLINANHSVSMGINWNVLINNQSATDYNTATSWRFYCAFNF